ncbi:GntR family transcriptional regulator [Almyronema epifaneia]|uniref:GntR family transcriptional regulator n=1 Tax=Almyronema epifaneia S1 TaxID=2991925 RepID=A0ABW6IAK6_9CYAN
MVPLAKSLQRRKSLYEQTYEALRQSILEGMLAPGDRLIETQIAQQLQVSRTPIREALRQLQQEELVTADANGWLRVATVSASEAVHLYNCRMALETLSVSEACNQATPTQLEQLALCVAEAEALAQRSPQSDLGQQLLALDYRFHHLIAESSGNQCLVSLLEQVFSKMMLLRLQTTRQNPNVLEVRKEHQDIYQAIAQQDPETAIAAITSHLTASKERVVKELAQIHGNPL